jgi:hypothetical protein
MWDILSITPSETYFSLVTFVENVLPNRTKHSAYIILDYQICRVFQWVKFMKRGNMQNQVSLGAGS